MSIYFWVEAATSSRDLFRRTHLLSESVELHAIVLSEKIRWLHGSVEIVKVTVVTTPANGSKTPGTPKKTGLVKGTK